MANDRVRPEADLRPRLTKDKMDFPAFSETSVISTVTGIAIGAGLVLAYVVNAQTQKKVLYGSSQQKFLAYALRVASVVVGYAIILFSARVLSLRTEQTLMDAALFILGIVGVLLAARHKLRRKGL